MIEHTTQNTQNKLEFYATCYVVIFREWAWGECTDTIRGVFTTESNANEYISKQPARIFNDSKVGSVFDIEKHNLI